MADVVFEETGIDGLVVLGRTVHRDDRGAFERLFEPRWVAAGTMGGPVGGRVGQVNRSVTVGAGTVRGLHFQHPPDAEARLVTCLSGSVLDVAVDLRRGSPTFLAWHGVELVAGDGRSLAIPAGCAHGFQVLTDEASLLYVHGGDYLPDIEGGIHPEDPAVGVRWPLPVVGLSDRDRCHPPVDAGWAGLEL